MHIHCEMGASNGLFECYTPNFNTLLKLPECNQYLSQFCNNFDFSLWEIHTSGEVLLLVLLVFLRLFSFVSCPWLLV
jgi:hypothetical protein